MSEVKKNGTIDEALKELAKAISEKNPEKFEGFKEALRKQEELYKLCYGNDENPIEEVK